MALDNALGYRESQKTVISWKNSANMAQLFHPQAIPVAEPVPVSNHVPYTVPIPDFFAFLFLYLFSL